MFLVLEITFMGLFFDMEHDLAHSIALAFTINERMAIVAADMKGRAWKGLLEINQERGASGTSFACFTGRFLTGSGAGAGHVGLRHVWDLALAQHFVE